MAEIEKILRSEENLAIAEQKFAAAQQQENHLRQRRKDGKLIYDGWVNSPSWQQWRTQQLERQKWLCACCGLRMGFGEKNYLPNGDFKLEPQHPTVDHILPKAFFPELTLNKQNLAMVCWACNKRKGSKMVPASRMRHDRLKPRLKDS